jgi:hypothetical protein
VPQRDKWTQKPPRIADLAAAAANDAASIAQNLLGVGGGSETEVYVYSTAHAPSLNIRLQSKEKNLEGKN